LTACHKNNYPLTHIDWSNKDEDAFLGQALQFTLKHNIKMSSGGITEVQMVPVW